MINTAPTIMGADNEAFEVIGGPAAGTLVAPGGSVSFVIRLTAAYEGS